MGCVAVGVVADQYGRCRWSSYDFDGTAALHDVAEHLLVEFGDPAWPTYDDAVDRGEIGLREAIVAQDLMLRADREAMLAFDGPHVRALRGVVP